MGSRRLVYRVLISAFPVEREPGSLGVMELYTNKVWKSSPFSEVLPGDMPKSLNPKPFMDMPKTLNPKP